MANKGTYHVHDPEGQPAVQDSSYKSFLCILLVFTAICVLVVVFFSANWFKTKDKESVELNNEVEFVERDRYTQEKSKTSDRAKVSEKNKTTTEVLEEKDKSSEDSNEIIPHKGKEDQQTIPPVVNTTENKEKQYPKNDTVASTAVLPTSTTLKIIQNKTETEDIDGANKGKESQESTLKPTTAFYNNSKTSTIGSVVGGDTSDLNVTTTEDGYEDVTELILRQTDKISAASVTYISTGKPLGDSRTPISSKINQSGTEQIDLTTELTTEVTTELVSDITNEKVEASSKLFGTTISLKMKGGGETTEQEITTMKTENPVLIENEQTIMTTEEATTTTIQPQVPPQPTKAPLTTSKIVDETLGEITGEASPEDFDDSNIQIKNSTSTPTSTSLKSTTTTAKPTSQTTTTSTSLKPSIFTTAKQNSKTVIAKRNKFKMAVSHMLGMMDHTTDMCEDFYWYSCGAATENDLPESRKHNAFRERLKKELNNHKKVMFTDKMKHFYETCVDHEAVFDYEGRVNEVKDAARQFVNDNPSKENLTKLFVEMALTNSLPVMEVGVDVCNKTNKYVYKLTPPYRSLTKDEMEHWSALYNTDSNCIKKLLRDRFDSPYLNLDQTYKDYTNCTIDFQQYLVSFNITKKATEFLSKIDNLEFYVENEVLDYTKNVKTSTVRDSILSETYIAYTIKELQGKFDTIDWEMFFRIISGHDIDYSSKIFVYEVDILQEIFNHLNDTPITRSYNNFLAIYINDIYQNSVIPKAVDTREEFCSKLVDSLFPDISSYLYMEDLSFDQMTKATEMANKVFEILRTSFSASVEASTSIEDGDKIEILNRITTLVPHFMNKTDECISALWLNKVYQLLDLNTSYISQLIEMRKYRNGRKFALVGEEFKDSDIFCHFIQPQDLKPKSFYYSTKIAIPYEFMLPWNMDYPGYFLMAKVGTNIAIEIGKLFNKVGIRYVISDNEILDPLHVEVMEDFYTVQEKNVSMTVSGIKNIQSVGDNAGFKLSHNVYNEIQSTYTLPWVDFTDEKIFFIATAQEFCEDTSMSNYMLKLFEGENLPNYWRLNNMVINTEKFRTVFGCRRGCNMSPAGSSHLAFPELEDEGDY